MTTKTLEAEGSIVGVALLGVVGWEVIGVSLFPARRISLNTARGSRAVDALVSGIDGNSLVVVRGYEIVTALVDLELSRIIEGSMIRDVLVDFFLSTGSRSSTSRDCGAIFCLEDIGDGAIVFPDLVRGYDCRSACGGATCS